MLIKALCDYYEILADQGKVVENGFAKQSVSYMIFLSPEGEVTQISDIRVPTVISVDKKGKEKIKPLPIDISLPYRPTYTSVKSYDLEHRPKYIFGLKFQDNEFHYDIDQCQLSHEVFVKQNLDFVEGLSSPIIDAYRNFITSWVPENETQNPHICELGKEFSMAGMFFALDGHPETTLHTDPLVLEKIRENSKANEATDKPQQVCAISGEKGTIARIHSTVKGIVGQKAGIFVCVNNTAEESYNKTQSYNSNISEDTVSKYTEAFNILTADKKHKEFVGDMTIVYWAMTKESTVENDFFSCLAFDKPDTPEDIQLAINQAMVSIANGKAYDFSQFNIDENIDFYIAGFTPNSSRVSQKFIYHNKFGKIFANAMKHQLDLATEKTQKQITVYQIARELKSPNSTSEVVSSALAAQLFNSIVNGARYPMSLLETVVRRIKIDSDNPDKGFRKISDTRISIIKACINRNARLSGKEEEIKMALDTQNTNPAYLCGRLFAVLEKTQKDALGDINTTIKDSYFATACAKPSVVFPRLLKLNMNHLSKMKGTEKDKTSFWLSKSIGEILSQLDNEFPSTLSLEDQGKFIIGYYQQNADFYKKREVADA